MKKLNQAQLLNLFALLFVAVIGVGLVSLKTNELKYELSPGETLALMASKPMEMTKEEALQLLENPGPSVKFIDIRDADKYLKGHVEGALNIPVPNLTQPDNLALLKNTAHTLVLYGQDKAQAYGPWLLFQQMGMAHIKFIPGGYDDRTGAFIFPDPSPYDYKKILDESRQATQSPAPEPAKPAVSKPKKAIAPSPPKKAAAKEEEGC